MKLLMLIELPICKESTTESECTDPKPETMPWTDIALANRTNDLIDRTLPKSVESRIEKSDPILT
jgi:hypothetical protein